MSEQRQPDKPEDGRALEIANGILIFEKFNKDQVPAKDCTPQTVFLLAAALATMNLRLIDAQAAALKAQGSMVDRTGFKCPHCASPYFGPEFEGGKHVGRYCKGHPTGYDRSYHPCKAKYVERFKEVPVPELGRFPKYYPDLGGIYERAYREMWESHCRRGPIGNPNDMTRSESHQAGMEAVFDAGVHAQSASTEAAAVRSTSGLTIDAERIDWP